MTHPARLFKVIYFLFNRKPIDVAVYDYTTLISYVRRDPVDFCRQTYLAKSRGIAPLFSESHVILAAEVLPQCTHLKHKTDDKQ